jgi:hypothetical protein
VPANVGVYRSAPSARPTRRGVIYTIGPSYIDPDVIWAGTDDGLIHVTSDAGKTWRDVTPPALGPWAKVSLIDASHFDVNGAYAAINTLRLNDLRPHILRTRDGGKSWTEITTGLPDGSVINVVREDPQRRGLLFAGSETAVHVSFDDGERWQPLRLNMPATSIRDLVIKDADLVAGTHGRGFWILDDISPLRQITSDVARAAAYLMRPSTAWRFRSQKYTDTPLPPDEPTSPNPPDGVAIDYVIGAESQGSGPVTLEIVDSATGDTIRRYSSDDPVDVPLEGRNMPDYWLRPERRLMTTPGLHRFYWDVRYTPPAADRFTYPISAVPGDTPKAPLGMWVMPGTYQVRLTVAGRVYRQAVLVRMDPRVRTSTADLQLQFTLSRSIDQMLRRLAAARAKADTPTLQQAQAALTRIFETIQRADAKPTAAQESAAAGALAAAAAALGG